MSRDTSLYARKRKAPRASANGQQTPKEVEPQGGRITPRVVGRLEKFSLASWWACIDECPAPARF